MTKRGDIPEPTDPVGKEQNRWKSPRHVVDPFRQADAIDWWQEQRWAARALCRRRDDELREFAQTRVAELSLQELVRGTSVKRRALEFELIDEIQRTEIDLASALDNGIAVSTSNTDVLTGYDGWNRRDLSKLALGGSGTAAVAAVVARASPSLLGLWGLTAMAAFAGPVALTTGAAAFAWSAASVAGGKRPAYLKLVQEAVTRLLIGQDSTNGSVLSRHFNRIDEAYKLRCENAA